MTLAAGSVIGPYEILAELGRGGMGVVFRARDSRLQRDVALKVLPDFFAADTDRLARFQREAQILAALNHSNIAAIYGIEEAAGQRALVMELVEGVDLTEAIRTGRFAGDDGLEEARSVATQIASALEAAHEAGVVHRDLKPANIKLRADGTVKVLDFGLARSMDAGPGNQDPSSSPTMTSPAMTQAGMIMGTAAYMSPEQARGRPVDRRADIWAFGCVLYEMLTGSTAFARESVTDTLAAITRDEPNWKSHPGIPAHLLRLIRRCLDKDPRTRLRDIGEARIALSSENRAESDSATRPAEQPRSGRLVWIAALLVVAVAASAATWYWVSRAQSLGGAPALASISRVTTDSGLTKDPAVVPGGTLLAYASDRAGGSLNIWVQPLPDGQPVQVTHGEVDASEPAFSPDGSRIAYRSEINGGGLFVVPALGGTPRFLVARGRQPRFSPDGKRIAYVSGGRGAATEMWVIDAEGGTPRRVAADLISVSPPVWSPDGRFVATTARRGAGENTVLDWWLVDPDGAAASVAMGMREVLRSADIDGVPEAWGPGQIVFTAFSGSISSLWSIAVSPDGRTTEAAPRRITAGVGSDASPAIAVGSEEVAIYYANRDVRANIFRAPLAGVLSDASLERLTDAAAIDAWPSVSSDGRTMVFASSRLGRPSVWVRDLVTGRESPVTASGAGAFPTLSADGKRMGFVTFQPTNRLGFRAVDGGEVVQRPEARFGWSWPRETMFLASRLAGAANELVVLNPATGQVRPVLAEMTKGFFGHGHLSPDGRSASAMEFVTADNARILVFPFGESPAAQADVVPLTGEQTVEEEHVWSPAGDAIYFVSERDGTRCLWKRKLDPSTRRPIGAVEPVLHLHGARRSMISTVESPQRFVLHDGKLYFSMQEVRANIWKATLKPRP